MTSQVISIALSLGAHGEEIARSVAEQLRFRYVNEEIIVGAAQKAGVSPQAMDQTEHSPTLVARVLKAMAGLAPAAAPTYWSAEASRPDPSLAYPSLIQEVIHETARQGSVVIAAHGASIHLAGTAGLLRVFVTASPMVRMQRLVSEAGIDEQEAKKRIEYSDRERAAYLRKFSDIHQELPTHYDLVLNTDLFTSLEASELITCAAAAMNS